MSVGYHIIADLKCENVSLLMTKNEMEEVMEEAIRKGNLTRISSDYHQFYPYGVSGVILLAESHLSFHSFPEYSLLTVDVYSCGERREERVTMAYDYIIEKFGAEEVNKWVLERG